MSQDDRLPPRPSDIRPRGSDLSPDSLPPLNLGQEPEQGSYSDLSGLQIDSMDRGSLSKFFEQLRPKTTFSFSMVILMIFIGSFILSVLFTSAILAGIIEIHPASIKSFFKALLGKG